LTRGPDQLPSRLEALTMYTWNSAWLSFDENERGSLEPGKLADLAVLDGDYVTVPVDDIPQIQSQLTMVGGRIVYAAGLFAAGEQH
jgi:predicted amidohydrolase YtcJ